MKKMLTFKMLICFLTLPGLVTSCVKFNHEKIVIPEQVYELQLSRELLTTSQEIQFNQVTGAEIEVKTQTLPGFLWEMSEFDAQSMVTFTFKVELNTLLNLADNLLKEVIIGYNNMEWWININLDCGKQDISLLDQNAGSVEVENPSQLITDLKAAYILWYANKDSNQYWLEVYSEIDLFKDDPISDYEILLKDFKFSEITMTSVLVTAQNSNYVFKKSMVLNFVLVPVTG